MIYVPVINIYVVHPYFHHGFRFIRGLHFINLYDYFIHQQLKREDKYLIICIIFELTFSALSNIFSLFSQTVFKEL